MEGGGHCGRRLAKVADARKDARESEHTERESNRREAEGGGPEEGQADMVHDADRNDGAEGGSPEQHLREEEEKGARTRRVRYS